MGSRWRTCANTATRERLGIDADTFIARYQAGELAACKAAATCSADLEPLGLVERYGRGWKPTAEGERRCRWALRELDPPPLWPIASARARSLPLAA